jgi:hypothetical protein
VHAHTSVHAHTPSHTTTHRCEAVNFIKEDDGWLVLARLLKQQPQLLLCLAHPLGQQVGALAHVEGDLRGQEQMEAKWRESQHMSALIRLQIAKPSSPKLFASVCFAALNGL